MALNPLEALKILQTRYLQYLKTTFNISHPEIKQLFEGELANNQYIKGPILEITPPYVKGASIQDLISEGILSSKFKELNQEKLPIDRPLYLHQERAIRRAVEEKRNIVVASGTGSGKTEIFMIVLLQHLFSQYEESIVNNSSFSAGVRMLLLYPMNALVNDQLDRMRELFPRDKNFCVTFGRFTSETPPDGKSKLNSEQISLHPCEVSNREDMRKKPPHILLTNYAMLEYLLLRPEDTVFFDGDLASYWKYIVIDEAHTYTGAKGIEMSMLLRRLKERVTKGENGINCIATSATLGKGENAEEKVSQFAKALFSEDFSSDDIIQGIREEPDLGEGNCIIDKDLYHSWADHLKNNDHVSIPDLIAISSKYNIDRDTFQNAIEKADGDCPSFLYYVLRDDPNLIKIINVLLKGPLYIKELNEKTFSEKDQIETLIPIIELASIAHLNSVDKPLLSARYHIFVRSSEGAYIRFFPSTRVYLKPVETDLVEGSEFKVFEFGVCRYCGILYLLGIVKEQNGIQKLQQKINTLAFDNEEKIELFILTEHINDDSSNDDDNINIGHNFSLTGTLYSLCGKCGSIKKHNQKQKNCDCGPQFIISVTKINSSTEELHKCPNCFRVNSITSVVQRFFYGKDAIPSVLVTALFQVIPPIKTIPNISDSEIQIDTQDRIESFFSDDALSTLSIHGVRKLLIFSDSRQDAAFFAPYLNQTYMKLLSRALILRELKQHGNRILLEKWTIEKLKNRLAITLQDYCPIPKGANIEDEVSKWIMGEFLAGNTPGSLEAFGLLNYALIKPDKYKRPSFLSSKPWDNFTDEEIWIILQIMFDHFRRNRAVQYLDGVNPTDQFFEPNNFQYSFYQQGSDLDKHIFAWVPNKRNNNSRIDYLEKITQKIGDSLSKDDLRDLLKNIWIYFSGYFKEISQSASIKINNTNKWHIHSSLFSNGIAYYQCNTCKRVTIFNVKDICPTYRCSGKLEECNPLSLFKNNHYFQLYNEIKPIRMYSEEHTAQITKDEGREKQKRFNSGEIDILSCSTTFELGVDVGSLETVFLRNMPPTAANYLQRAGRAGRRTSSAALILTFCQNNSHDVTFFNDPMPYITGEITPPYYELINEKIIKRHLNATALASFWRENPETFTNVSGFFIDNDGAERFYKYLESHPSSLFESLKRIIPENLHLTILYDWKFIEDLFSKSSESNMLGQFEKVSRQIREEISILTDRYDELKANDEIGYAFHVQKTLNTIKSQRIIDFLASNSIIPKYGFPIDVVSLTIGYHSKEAESLDLQRDLKIAISEYAPGSQVVANGSIWKSQYIKKNLYDPKQEWIEYTYVICQECERYYSEISHSNKKLPEECESCHADLRKLRKEKLIIPQFGFATGTSKPKKPTQKRPKKTYSTRVFFTGYRKLHKDIQKIAINNGIELEVETASNGVLAAINSAGNKGFRICQKCGYSYPGYDPTKTDHVDQFGKKCENSRFRSGIHLGHKFRTDVLLMTFRGLHMSRSFWLSLLYAILEGASDALDISRSDLDGCLYSSSYGMSCPSLVIFDDFPGGAGHVRRISDSESSLRRVLDAAYNRVVSCTCGGESGESSCYGCLKNYRNQWCHDKLNRKELIQFFNSIK